MDTLKRKMKGVNKVYNIYTEEEAVYVLAERTIPTKMVGLRPL